MTQQRGTDVLAERCRWKSLGVVLVRQAAVVVDIVESTAFDGIDVPRSGLQPTQPRPPYLIACTQPRIG